MEVTIMRYSFTEKTSHRQQETAYMLYMIIGSYFHRCSCRSKALEENLFLYYKELQEKRQVEKERQIIRVSEGVLKDNKTDPYGRTSGGAAAEHYGFFKRCGAVIYQQLWNGGHCRLLYYDPDRWFFTACTAEL